MKVIPFQNVNGSVITVTSTATLLAALINTAQSTNVTPYPWQDPNADGLNITPEDGDIRVLWDGNTPTATKGLLLKEGGTYFLRLVDLTQFRLIRVGGTNVSCDIVVGVSQSNESTAIASGKIVSLDPDVLLPAYIARSNSASTAEEDDRVVKASAGNLRAVSMTNENASTRYLQVHNATSAPIDGSVPIASIPVPTGTTQSLDFGLDGRTMSTGIYVCASTTQNIKTLAGNDHLFDVQYT